MDCAKAVKATAHQLARLIYAMLTRGEQYVERDLATMETERRDRQIKYLQRQTRHSSGIPGAAHGARWSDEWFAEQGKDHPGVRTVDRPWFCTACPACRDQPEEEAA